MFLNFHILQTWDLEVFFMQLFGSVHFISTTGYRILISGLMVAN